FAIKMLQSMSGKTHLLITSICVIYKTKVYQRTVVARIKMRKLKRDEILEYIYRDNPLNCAGSYKLEKSGLSLVKSLKVSDPSSLTGLSLLSLMKILLKLDIPIPFKNK
ncbi:MAG: Maf family protein, partial [Bdellovibrionales bacterium]